MSKKLAILGAGESGIGAAILGKKMGYEVFLSDASPIPVDRKAELAALQVAFEEGGHSEERLLAMDEFVKSPGIPDKAPLIKKALAKGIPVISEIEFGFRYLPEGAKVIAITGTNGKTTTTLLTHHLYKTAGLKVALGGNIGVSLARLVATGGFDYYVVEVSSFQLEGVVKFRPDVAILLNITPDHLDRYDYSFEKYASSKFRITENLTHRECFIYCADSEPIAEGLTKRQVEASIFAVSTTKGPKWQAYLDKEHLIFNYQMHGRDENHQIPVSEIALIGKHNMINSMSAVLAALWMNIPMEYILKGLKSFINASHRLEYAGELDGVKFINDSKATNVDSVYYALDGIREDIIWIAGGIDKGNDYSQITDLVKRKVKGLVCLGVDNKPLRQAFDSLLPDRIVETTSIAETIRIAHGWAKSGDVILLSPACASFDLFKNYEDRGDQFKQAVKSFVNEAKVKA